MEKGQRKGEGKGKEGRAKNRVRPGQREWHHMSMSGSCLPACLTTTDYEFVNVDEMLSRFLTLSVSLSHRLSLCLSVLCVLCTCKDSLRTMQRRDIALSARTRVRFELARSLALAQAETVYSHSLRLPICTGTSMRVVSFINSPTLPSLPAAVPAG